MTKNLMKKKMLNNINDYQSIHANPVTQNIFDYYTNHLTKQKNIFQSNFNNSKFQTNPGLLNEFKTMKKDKRSPIQSEALKKSSIKTSKFQTLYVNRNPDSTHKKKSINLSEEVLRINADKKSDLTQNMDKEKERTNLRIFNSLLGEKIKNHRLEAKESSTNHNKHSSAQKSAQSSLTNSPHVVFNQFNPSHSQIMLINNSLQYNSYFGGKSINIGMNNKNYQSNNYANYSNTKLRGSQSNLQYGTKNQSEVTAIDDALTSLLSDIEKKTGKERDTRKYFLQKFSAYSTSFDDLIKCNENKEERNLLRKIKKGYEKLMDTVLLLNYQLVEQNKMLIKINKKNEKEKEILKEKELMKQKEREKELIKEKEKELMRQKEREKELLKSYEYYLEKNKDTKTSIDVANNEAKYNNIKSDLSKSVNDEASEVQDMKKQLKKYSSLNSSNNIAISHIVINENDCKKEKEKKDKEKQKQKGIELMKQQKEKEQHKFIKVQKEKELLEKEKENYYNHMNNMQNTMDEPTDSQRLDSICFSDKIHMESSLDIKQSHVIPKLDLSKWNGTKNPKNLIIKNMKTNSYFDDKNKPKFNLDNFAPGVDENDKFKYKNKILLVNKKNNN